MLILPSIVTELRPCPFTPLVPYWELTPNQRPDLNTPTLDVTSIGIEVFQFIFYFKM
jgi:hypothetical protein